MALTQRLELRQGQALVMTPQLQQAIKLLQMSNLELSAFVEQELEKNPLLERDEAAPREDASKEEAIAGADAALTLREDAPPADASRDLDTDYENVYAEDSAADRAAPPSNDQGPSSYANTRGGRFDDEDAMSLESTLARATNLHDHLSEQLHVACTDPRDRLIGAYLIDLIDEAGYLTGGITMAAQHLVVPESVVERVLTTIQSFDPTGVGARSLSECLALQLKEKNRFDPAMAAVIGNLELLAKRDAAQLMRVAQVSAEDLADMIAEIKQLNPKPGLKFGAEPVQPVVPDVFVRENSAGGFQVELNSDTLPRVLVNTRYYAQTLQRGKDAKTYLSDCLNTANWLVKSLDQRARTILKVSTEIVRQQDGFFVNGVTHLRPLNLRVIAEAISMHESTVSRVTANKYMATPRGTFELKYFFTSSIASSEGGETHSSEAVRYHIRELIEGEKPSAILSDDRIVEILRKTGIDIARRTVAKYREAMRIPSSVERRRMKQEMGLPEGVAAP